MNKTETLKLAERYSGRPLFKWDEVNSLAQAYISLHAVNEKLKADNERLVEAGLAQAYKQLAEENEDIQEVIEDKRRIAREMAVAIDGDKAAKQPSLCDVQQMVELLVAEINHFRSALEQIKQHQELVCKGIGPQLSTTWNIANEALRKYEK